MTRVSEYAYRLCMKLDGPALCPEEVMLTLDQVTLSSPIGPRKWITMHNNLDFTATNAIAYSGAIGTYGKTAAPYTASYRYGTVGGGNTGPKTSQAGGGYPV